MKAGFILLVAGGCFLLATAVTIWTAIEDAWNAAMVAAGRR